MTGARLVSRVVLRLFSPVMFSGCVHSCTVLPGQILIYVSCNFSNVNICSFIPITTTFIRHNSGSKMELSVITSGDICHYLQYSHVSYISHGHHAFCLEGDVFRMRGNHHTWVCLRVIISGLPATKRWQLNTHNRHFFRNTEKQIKEAAHLVDFSKLCWVTTNCH